jgi:hypothetical protein
MPTSPPRLPILTVLVCVVCFGAFLKQQSDWYEFSLALERSCQQERSHIEQMIFRRVTESQGSSGI